MTGPDPRTDPDVRWRAHKALTDVLRTAADVVERCSDRDGWFEIPDPISFGDVTGLITAGETRVLDRLEQVVADARATIAEVRSEVGAYQRGRYGQHWSPPDVAA